MMPRMRVLHVTSGLDRRSGGVAAAVLGLAAEQARAGLAVTVLSSYAAHEDRSAAADLAAAGVTVLWTGPVNARLIGWHRGNKTAADSAVAAADVVHVHALWEDVQHRAMRAARRRGVPYVVSPHGMLATWSLRQGGLKKRLYLALRLRSNLQHAAALHFTTAEEARQTGPLKLRPPSLVEPLGLDLTEFATLPPTGTFRNRYPELAGRPVVLFMSRLHAKKGLDLLVPAFAEAVEADAGGDARLVIAGPDEGGYEAVVRGLVERHGLAGRVTFPGMLRGPDRVAALADADLFVLPSYQENFGIVVPEALAAGTPVVVSDQVNFAEHLAGQDVGEVVPCDVDALAAALARWLGDAGLRAAAAGRARPLAFGFDGAVIARRWADHYGRLVGGRKSPAGG